jgi:drug/metabolite transporter (DMT)-like permease
MSVTAVLLLFVASFTHAGWNFFSKKEHPTLAFYLVANIVGMLCVLPLIFFYWNKIFLVPAFVWFCLVCSGFFLAAYMAFLAGAYRTGDLSIAYPLARALPTIFVTLVTTLLMGKIPVISPGFVSGVIFVTAGCLILPMPYFSHFSFSKYKNLSCLLAIMAAVCIAGYTIIDSEAMGCFLKLPGSDFNPLNATLIYLALEAVACSFWKGLLVLCSARERDSFVEVLKGCKIAAAKTGIGIYLTYALVLLSMNFVTNVSYVAAFRQLSIPIGAIMGMLFLGESRCLPKVTGVVIIFSGLILLSVG